MSAILCSSCHATLRSVDAAFCGACGAAQVVAPPDVRPTAAFELALDRATLADLRAHARGLLRLRVANPTTRTLAPVTLHATWSGEPLPTASCDALAPGETAILATPVTPTIAGIHELGGELVSGDLRARFANQLLRVGGDGPQVQVVHIDQSSARVVDNSRSSFGVDRAGGLVDSSDWHAIELAAIAQPTSTPTTTATPASLPRVDFAVTTATATYDVTETLARGDIATVYGGRIRGADTAVAVKIADQSSDNDLLQHETRVLGLLLAEPHATTIHFAPPRDQFRTADGRLGSVFDRLDGLDLTALRDRFRTRSQAGLPAKHVVWILRRALAALGRAHHLGILHGNVDPSHILVRGRDHMVWLVDWCWAVVNPAQTGQGFKALNETFSAPEVRDRGRPTPASDLYALGKCAIHVLGGDPAAKTFPDAAELDPRLARFIKFLCVESHGGRAQDAWELYLRLEKIREQIWGAHEFVPLDA